MHQVTLTYSLALIRKAVFSFWYKTIGPCTIIASVVLVGLLAFQLYSGDFSWVTGALGVTLLFECIVVIMLYFVHYRNSLKRFRKMKSPEAIFSAAENNFTISSDAGTVTLPWSSIEKVWQFPDFYLLFYSKAQFNIFPLSNNSKDIQDYIIQKIREAGGKVS